ncbi:hypothetical protein B0H17DRAFT_1339694 [Mycena rosella]|uniref:Uncharacterized protein n=1 Tax=Mycena rosella TaxID=1033263 RepID=A0AAD7FRN9_MYCRO|nr:hypothetical protein B0H17DRAFT_1339694 [Mycena rosella]
MALAVPSVRIRAPESFDASEDRERGRLEQGALAASSSWPITSRHPPSSTYLAPPSSASYPFAQSITKSYYRGAADCFLVYGVASLRSLEDARNRGRARACGCACELYTGQYVTLVRGGVRCHLVLIFSTWILGRGGYTQAGSDAPAPNIGVAAQSAPCTVQCATSPGAAPSIRAKW